MDAWRETGREVGGRGGGEVSNAQVQVGVDLCLGCLGLLFCCQAAFFQAGSVEQVQLTV